MLSSLNQLTTLGVINITPDSFSDETRFTDKNNLEQVVAQFKNYPQLVFDFGFESTAPMNTPIAIQAERDRFDHFFHFLKDFDLNGRWISFDTYNIDNFRYFENQFKERYQNCSYIFNDVSGVMDQELADFLKTKIQSPDFYYLHNFTYLPDRTNIQSHMDYVKTEAISTAAVNHFKDSFKWFQEIGFDKNLLFDLGFGFSKSYEQNWQLINELPKIVNNLKKVGIDKTWVLGISKKSFLKKASLTDSVIEREALHLQILTAWIQKNCGHLLFRVHDPEIVIRALKLAQL